MTVLKEEEKSGPLKTDKVNSVCDSYRFTSYSDKYMHVCKKDGKWTHGEMKTKKKKNQR